MPKPKFSIISKLALLIFAVGLPLSGILAWSIHSQFRSDVTLAEQRAASLADAIAASTEITLNQTRTMVMVLAKRLSVQAMDRSHCDPFLADLRQALPQYANINVMNKRWEFVCSALFSDPNVITPTIYPEVYEKMKAANDLVMSAPLRGQLTDKWVVFAAYPVKDATNKLLGAVTAPIDLNALASAIADKTLPTNAVFRIVDRSGYIVASYPETERIGKLALGVAATAISKKSGASIERGYDGVERVYAFTPVKGSDWIALAGLPTEWAFADFRRNRNQILLALLVVLALATSFAFIMARQIARPIRELQQDAEVLANGRLEHRSQVVTHDEIGQLAATFNHMAQTLEANDTEHKQAEISIRHLNRVYMVLSQINALIIRVPNRDELFKEACRIAVEAGGFRMSLITTLDKNTVKLTPVASAGKDDELMAAIKALLSSSVDAPRTMVARTIREKKAIVSNDSQNDPCVLLGKKYADCGVRSMAILPLMVANEAIGVITLYASEIDFFHEQEMQLLTELAGDIAFAVDHIDKQERLNYLAYYDAHTGLANRSLFLERVAQYMRSAASDEHKLAIGLIDLERFKNINDSLGRTAGDALLKQVAEWLTQKTGDINVLSRIDADHFAIILPEVKSAGNLTKLVENLMASFLEHPFRLNDAVFRIAAKVGIAVFPDDGTDADTLFRNAEAALKKAKASGERYLFHTQNMTAAVASKLTLENQLRQALDNEEFVLHYQPKVNLVSGRITSAEALIRWNDPRTGLVPPDRFIPILEETGLIYEVGRWALRKAIQDYLRWRAAGLAAVRIAVNVSPLQLRNRGFIAEIEQNISIDPHAAAGLELEITESLIMADVKHSITSLQAIRAMGISIAIDDFGTGFSSLSYLAKLPVDTLKIDRSFVLDMTTGPEGLALVSTIINLAHSLNLKVVAEGVETDEQSRLLRLLNCDEIQGFLFSKPVPGEVFETRFLTPPTGEA